MFLNANILLRFGALVWMVVPVSGPTVHEQSEGIEEESICGEACSRLFS